MICDTCLCKPVCGRYIATGGVNKCVDAIVEKRGQWIYKPYLGDEEIWLYHCSECDSPNANAHNFCPHCGTKMDI